MIDTFYRIKAFHDLGIQIHLHCFEYGRRESEVLASLCKSVRYYPRKSGIASQLSILPYIVRSRQSDTLLENLMADDHPIFFDGLHTTYYLKHPALKDRKKFIRAHNIEHKYYRALAKNDRNILKKMYFLLESFRLKFYEEKPGSADLIFPVSMTDKKYFSSINKRSVLLPPFVPFDKINCKTGSGEYIIYHGDLTVNENQAICEFLIDKVFSRVQYPCIIAGKDPSLALKSKSSSFKNIKIIPDPDERQMLELITNAHINLIPAKTCNGFRLKLLFALFAGRHCLVNSIMVKGTELDSLCHIADSSLSIVEKINNLMGQPFTEGMIMDREDMLADKYNNIESAKKLASLLFDG
jgi:hypothetical protein